MKRLFLILNSYLVLLFFPTLAYSIPKPIEGKILKLSQPLPARVSAIAIATDRNILAVASNKKIFLIDLNENYEVNELEDAHSEEVKSVKFSPEGDLLASGSDDAVCLWSINRVWKKIACCNDKSSEKYEKIFPTGAVTFNPNGKILASGWNDGVIRFWKTDYIVRIKQFRNKPATRLHDPDGRNINSISFSQDGKMIAYGSSNKVLFWRAVDSPHAFLESTFYHSGEVTSVDFHSSDRNTIVSGSKDSTIRIWNTNRKDAERIIPVNNWITFVKFIQYDSIIVAGFADGTVRILDISSTPKKTILATLQGLFGKVSSIAFNPKNNIIYSGLMDGSVRSYRIPSSIVPVQFNQKTTKLKLVSNPYIILILIFFFLILTLLLLYNLLKKKRYRTKNKDNIRDKKILFISHKSENKPTVKLIQRNLANLEKNHNISIFVDNDDETPGSHQEIIFSEINKSVIGILMICPEFFTSQYCIDETLFFLEKSVAGDALVIPIIITNMVFENFYEKNKNKLPEESLQIIKGILPIIEGLKYPSNKPLGDCKDANTFSDVIIKTKSFIISHLEKKEELYQHKKFEKIFYFKKIKDKKEVFLISKESIILKDARKKLGIFDKLEKIYAIPDREEVAVNFARLYARVAGCKLASKEQLDAADKQITINYKHKELVDDDKHPVYPDPDPDQKVDNNVIDNRPYAFRLVKEVKK